MIKILAFVGAGLALGGGLAVAVVMGMIPVPFGPMHEARMAAEKAKPPVTVMYPIKERVVNLTDKGTTKYLKAAVTLEFIDHAVKEPPKGHAVVAQQEHFAEEMVGHAAVIEDALLNTLASKTSAELLRPEGKEMLKNELIERINHSLHEKEHVVNVYFTSFIIQ
jgi:flagellar FliL protein